METLSYITIIVSFMIAQFFVFGIMKKICKVKQSPWVVLLTFFIVAILFGILIFKIDNLPAIYLLTFMAGVALIYLCFKTTLLQAYFCSVFYVFHLITLNGMSVGALSLLLKRNSFQILSIPEYHMNSILLTIAGMCVVLMLYYTFLKPNKLRCFFSCKVQLIYVLIAHFSICLFMLFHSFGFYYNLDLIWISISQILVGLILYIAYMLILNYGVRVSNLLQYDIRSRQQLEMIKSQLHHQHSLEQLSETLNTFKHAYREQLLSIEYYAENQQCEEIKKEIKKEHIQILNAIPYVKKYSNNALLNSLFIDLAATAQEEKIAFDALLYVPKDISLHETELHGIMSVLLKNAFEATVQREENRFVRVKSSLEGGWLSIRIENSYEKPIYFEGDRPASLLMKADYEGLGLIYVEDLLEVSNNMIRYEDHAQEQYFTIVLLLHVHVIEEEESRYE